MQMIFYSHVSKTHFHNKGFARSLVFKVRVFGTRKWPNSELVNGVDLAWELSFTDCE